MDAPASSYRIGSLFSGAGGLDLGFLLTGRYAPLFAVEILERPAQTYSANLSLPVHSAEAPACLPAVLLGDVERIDFSRLEADVDLLVAGPPCQDFSVVRGPEWDRRGIQAKRGRLYQHFIRALKALRPPACVFENVPGLMSSNGGAALEAVLGGFAEAGWTPVFAGVVDAVRAGVPQARRRFIAIAVRADIASRIPPSVLRQMSEKLSGPCSILAKYPLTPLEAFEGRPLDLLGDRYREVMEEYADVVEARRFDVLKDYLALNRITPDSSREVECALEAHRDVLAALGWLNRPVAAVDPPDGTGRLLRESEEVLQRMRRIPPGANHEHVRGTPWEVEGRGISLVYRRIHPLRPAYTVVAYGGGGTWGYHYERNRGKLTHRERARLQGFPDWFLFRGGVQEVRAQIGEAVPPPLARLIAEVCADLLAAADPREKPAAAEGAVAGSAVGPDPARPPTNSLS